MDYTFIQKKHRFGIASFVVAGGFLILALIIGMGLANERAFADPVVSTASANASVNVLAACSLSGGNNNFSGTIANGVAAETSDSSTFGPTAPIKAVCNDPNGFGIYAIGYSGSSYDSSNHTKLISSLGTSYDINTATNSGSNDSSYWAFKLSAIAGTYTPIIAGSSSDPERQTGDTDYSNYAVVPDNFTKVAYRTSNTDVDTPDPNDPNTTISATGSSVTPTYKIYIGGSQPAGTYSGKVKYTLVHPSTMIAGTYNIAFNANGGSGSMTGETGLYNFEDHTLPSITGATSSITPPAHYAFAGWCTTQDTTQTPYQTTCSGNSYSDAGTIIASTTSANTTLDLYAYWQLQSFTCNQQYRLQNADGSWGEYISDGSTTTTYGNTCTYTKQYTDYKDSATGINDSAASVSVDNVTTDQTLSLDFYRNTYALTVDKNNTAISSTTGAGTNYRWGQDISISATTNTGYGFTNWSQTAGTTSSFADNTAASTTFTMPKSDATIYADGAATQYTITLNQNGATTSGSTSTTATYNSNTITAITNPQRTYNVSGFTLGEGATGASVTFPTTGNCTGASSCTYSNTFNGWYNTDASTGGTEIITNSGSLTPNNGWTDANSNWTSTSDQTIYARWSAGTSITLPTITKTGYNCGWSENSSASTYTYESGYTGLTLDSNKTLYGICEIKSNLSLKVSFDSNVSQIEVREGATTGTLKGTVTTSGTSVSGLLYNMQYYLIPTYASGYELNAWSQDTGTVNYPNSLSSTSAANPYYTIGDGSNGVTLSSKSSKIYMQTMTADQCVAGSPTTVYDSRDEEEYKVQRLADGKCWMVENLNLAGGTALSANDTNVTSAYISSFSTSNNLTKSGNTIVLPAPDVIGTTDNYSYVYNSGNKTSNCADPGCYSYYSWDAATLGSGRSIATDNQNAPYSICPKNWKLPTTYKGTNSTTDFRALIIALGGSNSVYEYKSSTSPTGATMYGKIGQGTTPNFLLAGYYYGGTSFSSVYNGYYWSATSYSSTSFARYFYLYSTKVNSANINYRSYGLSVRCLFSG